MNDFIKREDTICKLHNIGGCGADPESWADGWDKAINEAIKIVHSMPVDDAVEVVRCKDCRHYNGVHCESEAVWNCLSLLEAADVISIKTSPNHFCAYGERRCPTSTADLKPCPFCGKSIGMNSFKSSDEELHLIVCTNCGCRITFHDKRENNLRKSETIEAWNRRVNNAEI